MHRLASITALAACLLFVPACGGSGGGGPAAAGAGPTLRVLITDAPFPSSFVDSATVVIQEVRVHDKAADSWVTVFEGSAEIDLVPLTGGVADLLVSAPIDPGTYDEVRLIVDAGEVILNAQAVVDGSSHTFNTANGNLKFPSGAQTGIKVKIDNDIVVTTQLSADLVLDFDLSRNFVFNGPVSHAPGVKRVIFTPVVRATNASTAGTASLDVQSDNATPGDAADDFPLAGATVRLFDPAETELAMALADALGHAQFSVAPGLYHITVEAAAHDSGVVPDFDVFLANVTDLGVVVLVASETEIVGSVLSDASTPLDTADDTVLPGVLVEATVAGDPVVMAWTTTDEQGAFVLAMLAPGDYDLTFSSAGWRGAASLAVTASLPGAGVGLVVRMEALTRDVSGTVTDNVPAAIAGATVTIRDANGDPIGSTTTAGDGSYAIPGVPSGSHTITADDAGTTTTQDLDVVGTDPTTAQIVDVAFP